MSQEMLMTLVVQTNFLILSGKKKSALYNLLRLCKIIPPFVLYINSTNNSHFCNVWREWQAQSSLNNHFSKYTKAFLVCWQVDKWSEDSSSEPHESHKPVHSCRAAEGKCSPTYYHRQGLWFLIAGALPSAPIRCVGHFPCRK